MYYTQFLRLILSVTGWDSPTMGQGLVHKVSLLFLLNASLNMLYACVHTVKHNNYNKVHSSDTSLIEQSLCSEIL